MGIRIPAPAGAESLPASAREVARSAGRRDVDPPHPRCSSVGGDAHIAPPFSHHIPGRQSRPPLQPSTVPAPYPCPVIPRARSARGNPSPFLCLRRPVAATYLCRFAAKARFDNRLTQGERFPKGRGRNPSPFGRFKGKGFLRKGGNRNPPFLKWRSLVTFFRQGKKVTRRRQKGKGQKERKILHGRTESSAPYNRLPSIRPSTKHPHHSTTSPPAAQPPLPRQLYVNQFSHQYLPLSASCAQNSRKYTQNMRD